MQAKSSQLVHMPDLSDVLSIDDICDNVSNGSTLAQYCRDRGLNFGDVRHWIEASNLRKRQYNDSLAARRDWAAQTLCHMVLEMVKFDPKSVFFPDGTIKPLAEWPAEARAALDSFESDKTTGQLTKVRFNSRLKAIELMGKTVGMFADKLEVEGKGTFMDVVLGSMRERKDDTQS